MEEEEVTYFDQCSPSPPFNIFSNFINFSSILSCTTEFPPEPRHCNITGDYQVKWQQNSNLLGLITGRVRSAAQAVTEKGRGEGGALAVFPLSLMSLSTPVNISEAARSCIICEVEPRADTLSDTHTKLKMIVTLLLGSRTSPTTISLGSTTLWQIREMY